MPTKLEDIKPCTSTLASARVCKMGSVGCHEEHESKLEDIPTPLCDSNIMGKFSNPELVYVNIEFARKLEKWLHVAKEERDDALTHERDAQKGAKTNAEVARRLAASNYELRLESDKANQKCQLFDELVFALTEIESHLGNLCDALDRVKRREKLPENKDYLEHEIEAHRKNSILIRIALSKAAKTL